MDELKLKKVLEEREAGLRARIFSLNQSESEGSEFINRLIAKELKALDNVRAALERMFLGDYGECASCDCEIPFERLEKDPEADYCTACEAEHRQELPLTHHT